MGDLSTWLGLKKQTPEKRRQRESIAFNVTQIGNRIEIEGDGSRIDFAVEGIEMPPGADASFAVWALLPRAMEEGFHLHINRPIDPKVAANAERLTRIWEMWVPSRYRSIKVSGEGGWSRISNERLPQVNLYSGGVDSTYSILRLSDRRSRGYVSTIYGLDYRREWGPEGFSKLIAKTDPLLESLNFQRIIIRPDAVYKPFKLTAGFTLASCLFLLSDLFKKGTLAADHSPEQDMAIFPWATNHVGNGYFSGSDFAMQTVFKINRVEKLAAMAKSEIALQSLSFCRKHETIPSNCGLCSKCIRTKAMLIAATGGIPEIFIDKRFDERMMRSLRLNRRERTHVFNLYGYAKDRGLVEAIPGLVWLVEECRHLDAEESHYSNS
jgi:hypothetical protein